MTAQPIHDEPVTAVKTLTAEVRTVMMNNRQVTLSVARQLDRVDFFEMEPWGRISLPAARAKNEWGEFVEDDAIIVIGSRNGELVTAKIPLASAVTDRALPVKSGRVYVCHKSVDGNRMRPIVMVDGVRLHLFNGVLGTHKEINGAHCHGVCEPTFSDDIALMMLVRIAAHKRDQERDIARIEEARSMPKLVLAGLK